jgi:hypothetical protein
MIESTQSAQPETEARKIVPAAMIGEFRDMVSGVVIRRWSCGGPVWTASWSIKGEIIPVGERRAVVPPVNFDNIPIDVSDVEAMEPVGVMNEPKTAEVMRRAMFTLTQMREQAKSNAVRQALAGR